MPRQQTQNPHFFLDIIFPHKMLKEQIPQDSFTYPSTTHNDINTPTKRIYNHNYNQKPK